jgi:hypothetical protein
MKIEKVIPVTLCAILLLGGCEKDSNPVLTDTSADTAVDTSADTAVDTMDDVVSDVPEEEVPEPTAQELCEDLVDVTCDRSFECFTPAQIAAAGWTTIDDCIAAFTTSLNCASAGTCPAGQSYHNDQAALCVSDMQTQLCGDLIGGILPASCSLICQAT